MGLRILTIHPGADYSVHDVFVGMAEALTKAGHSVGVYALNGHIELAARYIAFQQQRLRRRDPSEPKRLPLPDIMSKASEGALISALRGRADLVLVMSALYFHPSSMLLLRAARVPVGVIFTESPYQDEEQYKYAGLASVCWTNDRSSVDLLREANPRTYYLPAAYRAGVHTPGEAAPDTPAHDVLFIGTLFQERADLLAAVDWTGIDFAIYGNLEAIDGRCAAARKLKPYVRGGVVENTRAIDMYRRAKAVLNPYRTSVFVGVDEHVTGESMNPRTYELAAVGTFQLSNDRPEQREMFGDSIPTYDDAASLEALVHLAMAEPDWRRDCAARARAIGAAHTFDARAAQVMEQATHALLHNPYVVPAVVPAAD